MQGFRCSYETKLQNGPVEEYYCTFKEFAKDTKELTVEPKWWKSRAAHEYRNARPTLFQEACASCTAITYVNGTLIGDPLDVKMFEATGWILDEPHTKQN